MESILWSINDELISRKINFKVKKYLCYSNTSDKVINKLFDKLKLLDETLTKNNLISFSIYDEDTFDKKYNAINFLMQSKFINCMTESIDNKTIYFLKFDEYYYCVLVTKNVFNNISIDNESYSIEIFINKNIFNNI